MSLVKPTEIFDVDGALIAETGRGDGEVFAVWDEGAIASFCDSKAVDRSICFESDLIIEIGSRASEWDGNFLWELLSRLACFIVSTWIGAKHRTPYLLAVQTKSPLLMSLLALRELLCGRGSNC